MKGLNGNEKRDTWKTNRFSFENMEDEVMEKSLIPFTFAATIYWNSMSHADTWIMTQVFFFVFLESSAGNE